MPSWFSPRPDAQSAFGNRRQWIYLVLFAALLLAWVATPLGAWLAGQVVQTIPLNRDAELGAKVASQFRSQVLRSAHDQDGLQAMGERLLRGMRAQLPAVDRYQWRFQFLNDESVNAFACPGGFIFVNSGLRRLATDDELAAVLGHEIGHVLHRHSLQRMVQSRLLLTVLEALLLGDNDGQSEAFGDELAGVLMQGAHTLLSLSYSRENEYEADAVAWWATLNAGYPPEATASFFKKLDSSDSATSWLSTHPATKDRIVALDNKGHELSELRRAGGSADVASHFAPALADESASGGVVGSMLGAIPAELQKQGLAVAVTGLATLVEFVLDELFKGPGDADRSAPPGSGPMVDCEDGESKISYERVRPGRYVALGHGKCLSIEDLRGMQRAGRLDLNPYTRRPFSRDERRRIDALLR